MDLNLLPLLHALLEEQNVTRAGQRVGLSPSAASHALARLRETLGDPLLVRAGRGLARTPRAEALRPQLQQVVSALEGILRPPAAVDPAALRRAFRVLAADDVRWVLLLRLDALLRLEAPGVDLYGEPLGRGALDRLRAGEADVSVAVYENLSDEFARLVLFRDELIPVARAGHPAAAAPLTPAGFAACTHALVAPLGVARGLVDEVLDQRGLSRRIARVVPSFLDAAALVAETDHLVTLPRRFIQAIQGRFPLVPLQVDLPFPRFRISAAWHRRLDADPEHRWFRGALARAGQAIDEG